MTVASVGEATVEETPGFRVVYSANENDLIYIDRTQEAAPESADVLPPDAEATAAAQCLQHRYGYRFAKRTCDILISLLVFALLWWVFLWIAIAIKLDTRVYELGDSFGPVHRHLQRATMALPSKAA